MATFSGEGGGGRTAPARGAARVRARRGGGLGTQLVRGAGWRRGRGGASRAGAYLQRPTGAAGPGRSRSRGRGRGAGRGRGVRAAHTARRAAHMRAPAPPTFDSFTAGGGVEGGGELSRYSRGSRCGEGASGACLILEAEVVRLVALVVLVFRTKRLPRVPRAGVALLTIR